MRPRVSKGMPQRIAATRPWTPKGVATDSRASRALGTRRAGRLEPPNTPDAPALLVSSVARDVSADCLEIRFAVARKRCPLAGNHADFHVFVRFEGERNDVFAVEFVADHARAHRVAVEAYEQVEQRRTVAHADVLAGDRGWMPALPRSRTN